MGISKNVPEIKREKERDGGRERDRASKKEKGKESK